jgi:predicted nuclease of restriction endonuclease-like RecB superfamily
LLTADLVHVRRRGDRLTVVPVAEAERPRARELAATALLLVRAHVGLPRGALLEAWSQVAIAPAENRLARGLFKLALDACEFEEGAGLDPVELRRAIFTQAAAVRGSGRDFDRAVVLADIAQARGLDPDAIEEALYSDLPTAHVLRKADLPSPDGLLAQHDLASHQTVLLRAVKVQARVFSASAGGYRALFRKLKFHRLLYVVTPLDRVGSRRALPGADHRGRVWEPLGGSHLDSCAGYAIDLDGPMSLFEQTTKYGLNLALALPAIMACDAWEVRADVRWGKDRRPLRYHLRGGGESSASNNASLPDEVAALLADLRQQESPWQVSPSEAILALPGLGVCVPDLEFVHRGSGQRVVHEVLGFWSRAAVWKRVEMAEAGLPFPVVFAVSKHLRVSEEVLPADAPAALYVYARTMGARAVLERVETVAAAARR